MYTKEQEEIALKAYEQLGSVHAVSAVFLAHHRQKHDCN